VWWCLLPLEEAAECPKLQKPIALQTTIAALKDVNAERQALTIGQVIKLLYSYSSYIKQINCIQYLFYVRSNLVLIAQMLFGKSMIMQLLSCFIADAVVIVVLLLNAIGAEQALKISTLLKMQLLFIYIEVFTQAMFADIRCSYYTYILISLELFGRLKLYPVMTDP